MPILSFYEGYSELSFCLYSNDLENSCKMFRFPYTYSHNLFANSFPREHFYKDVFNLAGKELGVNIAECDLYTIGFLAPPEVPFEVTKSVVLFSSMPENYIYLSSMMFALQNVAHSFFPTNVEFSDKDFRANLDLYHNIVYYDSRDIVQKDALLRAIVSQNNISVPFSDVTYTGDRLREFDINKPLTYLLLFDLIRNPGSFYLKMDIENRFAHSLLVPDLDVTAQNLGTLINVPGEVECLYETGFASPQLFELKSNNIFILPLDSTTEARVMLKSGEYKLEQKITGGSLGLIIDTRDKRRNIDFQEMYINYISQAINRI